MNAGNGYSHRQEIERIVNFGITFYQAEIQQGFILAQGGRGQILLGFGFTFYGRNDDTAKRHFQQGPTLQIHPGRHFVAPQTSIYFKGLTAIQITFLIGGNFLFYCSDLLGLSVIHGKTVSTTNFETMQARIKALWQQGHDDQQIAEDLTAEGFRSARAATLLPATVRKIRHDHGWRYRQSHHPETLAQEEWLTTGGLAALLGVERGWVYRKLRQGKIDPQYVRRHGQKGLHLIQNDPDLLVQLKQLLSETLEQ